MQTSGHTFAHDTNPSTWMIEVQKNFPHSFDVDGPNVLFQIRTASLEVNRRPDEMTRVQRHAKECTLFGDSI